MNCIVKARVRSRAGRRGEASGRILDVPPLRSEGSTGYQPVASGNLPDAMEVRLPKRSVFRASRTFPHSVRQVAERNGLVARSTQIECAALIRWCIQDAPEASLGAAERLTISSLKG